MIVGQLIPKQNYHVTYVGFEMGCLKSNQSVHKQLKSFKGIEMTIIYISSDNIRSYRSSTHLCKKKIFVEDHIFHLTPDLLMTATN